MNVEKLPTDVIIELLQREKLLKKDWIAIAGELNDMQVELPSFEQFSYPIQLHNLTIQQLKRFMERKAPTVERDLLVTIAQRYLGKTVRGNVEKCGVCYEFMGNQRNSLSCGHWVHYRCVGIRSTCPVCRQRILDGLPEEHRKRITRLMTLDKIITDISGN